MSRQRPHLFSRSIAGLAVVIAGSVIVPAGSASAVGEDVGIRYDGSPGTAAPPDTLGGYVMTPFAADERDLDPSVSSVPGPTGDVRFDNPMWHSKVGSGWATWSHGYRGDVYQSDSTNETITLPQGTRAFYFYAEPNPYDYVDIVAQTADGTSSGDVRVYGRGGARYYGFYATGAEPLSSITISSSDLFAIGEFGITAGIPQSTASAQVLFVHGVTQNFADETLFQGSRPAARQVRSRTC